MRPHVDIYSENNYLSAKLINMLRGNCCRKCLGNEEKRSESGRSAGVSVRLRLREFVNPLMATFIWMACAFGMSATQPILE